MSKPSMEFVVIRHTRKEEPDKETIYSVVLKTRKGATLEANMEIKSTSETLFSEYPLNECVEVFTKQVQTTLVSSEEEAD